MTRSLTCLSILLVGLLSVPPTASAQEIEGEFQDLVEVTEVLLDVLVLDRRGEPVRGLTLEDFVVEDEGEPVELTGAAYYTTRYSPVGDQGPVPTDSRAIMEVPSSRYFVFFFHDLRRQATPGNRLLRQIMDAGRQSQTWVREEMGPSDWVAVVSYDVRLDVHQDFTQDQGALLAAIDEATSGGKPRRTRREEAGPTDRSLPSLLRELPMGNDLRDRSKTIYEGLGLVAEAAGPIVGRKNLLLFSIGFGDVTRDLRARPDRRYYPALEEALNANNVAVYPIDLTPRNAEHLQADFLNTLADDSGGVYNQLFTSFLTPLREVASQSTGYYLLSFRHEHPLTESGYREVEVEVDRKKVEVLAPRGYRFGHRGG